MSTDNIWVGLTLSSLSEDFVQSIVNLVSVQSVQNALDTLFYEIPLGGVLLGLGVFFFVIAIFIKEH
ncbi:MAG: hypothetical protein HUN05_17290 [Desulfobacter sp.]|nr:MAG: hypothetical protein HUN05_17290 [Desulfobacter sp.]